MPSLGGTPSLDGSAIVRVVSLQLYCVRLATYLIFKIIRFERDMQNIKFNSRLIANL